MSGLAYWASLLAFVLMLVLMIVALILAVFLLRAVFDFIYPRMGPTPTWLSDLWQRFKIAIVLIAIVGFVTGVVVFARYDTRKARERAGSYARSQGWEFSAHDDELENRVADMLLDLNVHVYHVRTVQTGPFGLYLFDCTYRSKKAGRGQSQFLATAGFVQSQRFRSVTPLEISTRDWTGLLTPHKVDMGASPFAEMFLVTSGDPIAAKQIINASIQEVMLAHLGKSLFNPVRVILGNGGAVALTPETVEPERLQDLIELMGQLESAAR
jgi:energy-coupling factor transporter transmembrane protein EcfT